MEDFLQNVIKECGTFKSMQIKQTAQEAYDLLCSQCSLLRTPSHELRTVCFKPIKGCLESKKSKLLSLGLNGLGKIIKDERFQAGSEPEDDSLWLPAQLLHATSSIVVQCDDTQVYILKCILSMACSSGWALNGRLVMLIVGRCGEAYDYGTQPVRAAAQAAACQTLSAFCSFLDEECQEILQQQAKHRNSGSSAEMVYNKTSAVACFNEVIPVMQYVCSKLEESKGVAKNNSEVIFLLECLLTMVSALPPTVHLNSHFTTFLWQRFCPSLLALLGVPGEYNAIGINTNQMKTIYSIGIQVVRLVGRERALRPVLEALFHRMLLLPAPSKRLEPLRAAKELLRSPGRLVDLLLLSGPIHRHAGDDMAIIRLIMDSIEESASYSDVTVLLASVECVCALLSSLEVMCTSGEGLDADAADLANARYTTLEQADYTGPLTYQSLARLPKPYRDVVANLKYCNSDTDESSGIEGSNRGDDSVASDDSGATEGPEEHVPDVDDEDKDSIMDDESFLTNQQLHNLHKVPENLHFRRIGTEEFNTNTERHNARQFVKTLQTILLPNVLSLRSSIQVDEVLQEFASKCCDQTNSQSRDMVIMNADGIYLATYAALLLNYRLIRNGHYATEDHTSPNPKHNTTETSIVMTEAQFVDEIHGSGVLVYVSATWLRELYQNVIATSFLEVAGYDPKAAQQPALINLLTDVGGLCPTQQLMDWQKLQRIHGQPETSAEIMAGVKLSRRVLTCCWQSVVMVLSVGLGEPFSSTITKPSTLPLSNLVSNRSRKKLKQRMKDNIITASLEALQKAASLSNTLKLQTRSSSILGLLSSSACTHRSVDENGPRLLPAHALSLDVLLSKGMDLSVHSQQCWPHVFAACITVATIEHSLFSRTGSAQLLMVTAESKQQNCQITSITYNTGGVNEKSDRKCIDNEQVDVYNFLQTNNPFYNESNASQTVASNSFFTIGTTISEIVERSGILNLKREDAFLTGVLAAKVCCVLSFKADELFHNAAQRLALPALLKFLTELCKASRAQLFSSNSNFAAPQGPQGHRPIPSSAFKFLNARRSWWRRTNNGLSPKPSVSLLLLRVAEVTLKCIRSGRPLVHTMKIWSIVGPHFMEAACHKDREVSKNAITAIHDVITCLLNDQTELPHFHFNEALFKPFENLLCLEVCDQDVQGQIVSSLCEFVEANASEINSGWRPLFATLRNASASLASSATHVATMGRSNTNAILDIFYIFLQTDNTLVFSNAALDYILCLLAHVRIISKKEEIPAGNKDADRRVDKQNYMSHECLKLIENCSKILMAMYAMPKCPRFNMTHRISIETNPQIMDSRLLTADAFANVSMISNYPNCRTQMSYKLLAIENDQERLPTLQDIDAQNGGNSILKIWYILLEGLIANLQAQPVIQNTDQAKLLFKIMKDILPIKSFAFYCLNHLLLPSMQIWLRRNIAIDTSQHDLNDACQLKNGNTHTDIKTTTATTEAAVWMHYKYCMGLLVELVVKYLMDLYATQGTTANRIEESGDLALKQLLILLTETINTEEESVARLGVSCIRHIIVTLGQHLTSKHWEILVLGIHRVCMVTSGPLSQLIEAFKPHSNSFYGDMATVKVAARKTNDNLQRIYEIGAQVFLMSSQRDARISNLYDNAKCTKSKISDTTTVNDAANSAHAKGITLQEQYQDDDRSYVFLLYPIDMASISTPDLYTVRVPYKTLVIGLFTHQFLMQIISSILLQNLRHVTPILKILHITSNLTVLSKRVESRHIYILLKCLDITNKTAMDFDMRPGLKFLIQKVGNLTRAANLYTLANTSEVVQIIVLVEMALVGIVKYQLTSIDIKNMLNRHEQDLEEGTPNLFTDLDYVEEFLRQLRKKWEALCENYTRLTMEEDTEKNGSEIENQPENCNEEREVRRHSVSSSDSCASYLEDKLHFNCVSASNNWEEHALTSTDDETNEMAAKIRKYPSKSLVQDQSATTAITTTTTTTTTTATTLATITTATTKLSYDTNTLLQMNLKHQSSQFFSSHDSLNFPAPLSNLKELNTAKLSQVPTQNALPAPQPVPQEIHQQRLHSIEEDFDAFKETRIETIEACLELLTSLSSDKLVLLTDLLTDGAVILTQTCSNNGNNKVKMAAEQLLRQMVHKTD